MQIHELNSFVGTPSATDYLAIDDGSETNKVPATALGVSTQMTQAEAEAGTVTDPRVIAPKVLHDFTQSFVQSFMLNTFYPVGSYYETSDSTFNPNTAWGGTWVLETEGLVHIGAGSNYAVGDTGGEKTHTLTEDEMPSHRHEFDHYQSNGSYTTYSVGWTNQKSSKVYTSYTGGGQAHNIMQPYVVVNRWHRTA